MQIDNDILKNNIAEVLKQYRHKSNLTQDALAEKANISINFLQDIEYARSGISIITLINLCNALNITPNDVLRDFLVKPLNEDNLQQQINLLPPYEKSAVLNLIDYFNQNFLNK